MRTPAELLPRNLHAASRASSVFALAGAAVLLVLPLTVPTFVPSAGERVVAVLAGAVWAAVGVVALRAPHRLPGWFWATVPTQVLVPTVVLDLTTHDASATGQAFLIWPVLFAAYEMRPRVAAAVLAQVLAAEAVIVLVVLPRERAVTDLLCVGATLAVLCVVLVRAREREAAVLARLQQVATTDALTGLSTRGVLDEATDAALEGSQTRAALVLVDVDHFKSVNDTLGHPAGDAVLVHVAAMLRRQFPAPALVARLGGDELAVLLPASGVLEAVARAEEFRSLLRADPPRVLDEPVPVTTSIGVAAAGGGPAAGLYGAADRALYLAKAAGRDCVHGLPEPAGASAVPAPA